MKAFTQKFLSSIETRFQRSRAGSVLIIVIVLLLLLAILGAAYISTTRSSRVASAQNVLSSDVDSTLNGIAQVCQGVITDDLNDTFGNLRGNTAYVVNPAPTTPIINRSYYQGQTAGTPQILPNVLSYLPGDIANDRATPSVFYDVPQGSAAVPGAITVTAGGWQPLNGHLPITAVGSDPWLADRIPDPAGTGNPVWNHLTQSIQVISPSATTFSPVPMSILGTPFEDPRTGIPIPAGTLSAGPLIGPMTPTSVTLGNGLNAPALSIVSATPPPPFIAMDADGDGIGDSLPTRVPGMSVDGFTWYLGVRIIDNNSAINANTAWSRDTESYFAPNTTANNTNTWAMFQTSVGLQELANTNDLGTPPSLATLNKYRFNNPTGLAGQDPYDESPIGTNRPPQASDRGIPSGGGVSASLKDYNFISQSEAFYQQFIRRMANPGYNIYTPGSPSLGRYQALPLSDEAALAYHFCLTDSNSSSPQSLIETLLPSSLFFKSAGVPYNSVPYDPSNVAGWFGDNFKYPNPATSDNLTQPLRALLVTHNPVSNYIQPLYDNNPNNPEGTGVYSSSEPLMATDMLPYGSDTLAGATNPHYRGIWNSGTGYLANDIVLFPGPTAGYTGPSYTFLALANNTGTTPAAINVNNVMTVPLAAPTTWQLQPWSQNPVKANVNTATFRELFRAFWSVMAGNPSYATPFGVTGVDGFSIYDPTVPTVANPLTGNPQAMFRSPLRDPVGMNTANASLLDTPATAGTPPVPSVTNKNVMVLRAALAAVNTLGLRDNSQNVISRTLFLKNVQIDNGAGGNAVTRVELQVYSNAPQPVISEVFACTSVDTDTNAAKINPQGYVAIELYNPYPFTLTLRNWQLGLVNRNAAGSGYPNLSFQTTGTIPNLVSVIGPMDALNDPTQPGQVQPPAGTIIIPAHGYALLENYNGLGNTPILAGDALFRPTSAINGPPSAVPPAVPGSFWNTTTASGQQTGVWYGPTGQGVGAVLPNTCDVYVPNLQLVIGGTTSGAALSTGGELVLLRPRRADGNYSPVSNDPNNTFNEGSSAVPNLVDLVPVDSYDFSGLAIGTPGNGAAWSYVRMKGTNASTWFKQIFPGFYQANTFPREATALAGQGTVSQPITPAIQNWQGVPTATTSAVPAFGVDALLASYVNTFPPVQVYNAAANTVKDVMHFPNAVVSPQNPYPNGITPPAGQTYLHPLGGFARNGDMLDIPYIGAYRIRQVSTIGTNPGFFVEMNSLPKDCSLAAVETNVPQQDAAQNIGRFVPMAASFSYLQLLQGGATNLPDYSAWTRNIFNYLTVQSSTDAYLPNVDPNLVSSNPTAPAFAYPPQNTNSIPPTPVLTADAVASDQTKQDNVGVEGLININTASWKVLSMLPFVSPAADPGWVAHDQAIAKAIVVYRDGDGTATNPPHGPFMSIFDLNQVPGFQNGTGNTGTSVVPTAPTSATGLISPPDVAFPGFTAPAAPTGILEDYQWDCMTLNRISNLITTRSDTFTVYIVLQGWQNVGTGNAQPMVTRRFAYIVDRSQINSDPSSRFLKTLVVPND
jgi:hypothetical protein